MIKRLFIIFILVTLSISLNSFAKEKVDDNVYSTEGVDIDIEELLKSKPDPEQIIEQNERKNRSKQYIKVKKKIAKQDYKKALKEKEIEYIQNKLEIRKKKLEQFGMKNEKGEQEK